MTKKQLIIVGSSIAIIILILIIVLVNKKKTPVENVVEETSGVEIVESDNGYIVYNKKTGREITKVSEDEKYKLRIYELDPNYQEIKHEEYEGGSGSDSAYVYEEN